MNFQRRRVIWNVLQDTNESEDYWMGHAAYATSTTVQKLNQTYNDRGALNISEVVLLLHHFKGFGFMVSSLSLQTKVQ